MSVVVQRVVALGASNLTRGFATLVSSARAAWGPEVEILAALGHGRSYGQPSRVVFRTLPGILECGLWRTLEAMPEVPTRALVTDVGNDILYGASAQQILAWVDETVERLQRVSRDVVVTDLPLASIRTLSTARFLLFRSILFPACRLSLERVLAVADEVDEGLRHLSARRGLRLLPLHPSWYGVDPIHIRPSRWTAAWCEILGAPATQDRRDGSWLEGPRLYLMRPERRWLFGVPQVTPQRGVRFRAGGRVWLF